VLPDGTQNAIRLQRLKDKLGNRSNASAELEYQDPLGWRLGEEQPRAVSWRMRLWTLRAVSVRVVR